MFSWVSLLLLENKFRERKIIDALLLWLMPFNMQYVCCVCWFCFYVGYITIKLHLRCKMFGGWLSTCSHATLILCRVRSFVRSILPIRKTTSYIPFYGPKRLIIGWHDKKFFVVVVVILMSAIRSMLQEMMLNCDSV